MRRFLLFFIFSVFSSLVYAQDQKIIDSLTTALKTARDTSRVNVLTTLSDKFHQNDPKKAMKYADEAIGLAEELQFSNGLFHSYSSKALVLYDTGELDSALRYFEIAKKFAERNKDNSQLASVYSNIGNVYGNIGQNRKSLQYYLTAVEYTHKINNPAREAYMQVNIGTVYSVLDMHDSAIVYYLQAEKILAGIDKNQEKLPIVYGDIGASYLELHDTVRAKTAFEKALRISKLHNDLRGLASAYDHLGIIIYAEGKRDSAIVLLKSSINIYDSVTAKNGTAEVCAHLGEVYYEEKDYDNAIPVLNKGMKAAEELTDYYNMELYYEILSKVYEAKGNLGQALFYQRKLDVVKDTVYNLNNTNAVNEMKTEAAYVNGQHKLELADARDQKKDIIIYAAIALAVLILLLGIVAFNRYLVKKRSSELLKIQNDEINIQKNTIEEKNKDITDSIKYAQRIQNAILPSKEMIQSIFPGSFVFFRPKDIVSGDFYWFEKSGDYRLFSVIDCTGHGVPGAMLSVVGHNMLNKALHDNKLVMPDQLLQFLNENISHMLRQKHEDQIINDGMDIALCCYHEPTKTMYYAGSFNSLYVIRKDKLEEIKADKISIGNYYQEPDRKFTLHTIRVEENDLFYLYSDGFADQFGGPGGKKFKYKPFQQLLLSIHNETISVQEKKLESAFEDWKKNLNQVDDICVIGVRI